MSLPSIASVQNATADRYGVRVADIVGRRRYAEIVLPRHVAMYVAYNVTEKSFPQVARAFGGRHHTTVVHAYREVSKRIVDDPRVADAVRSICERLGSGGPRQ